MEIQNSNIETNVHFVSPTILSWLEYFVKFSLGWILMNILYWYKPTITYSWLLDNSHCEHSVSVIKTTDVLFMKAFITAVV